MKSKIIKLLTIVFLSITVMACGGSGGSDGGGSSSYTNSSPFADVANTTPIEGSVIQYVGAKDIAGIGITTIADGEVTFTDVIAGQPTVVLNPDDAINNPVPETKNGITWTNREYEKTLSNGEILEAIVSTIPGANTEYFTAGIWLEDSTAKSTFEDVGMFVDGGIKFPQTDILALTGEKTYYGIATFIYQDYELKKQDGFVEVGSYDVVVTVDFGTATEMGEIKSVAITDFIADELVADGARIDLQSASISDTLGGFTTGNTTGGADNGSKYAGKWGSQFYYTDSNNYPKYIGGTFGGAGTNIASDDGVFIGAFFADIQQ